MRDTLTKESPLQLFLCHQTKERPSVINSGTHDELFRSIEARVADTQHSFINNTSVYRVEKMSKDFPGKIPPVFRHQIDNNREAKKVGHELQRLLKVRDEAITHLIYTFRLREIDQEAFHSIKDYVRRSPKLYAVVFIVETDPKLVDNSKHAKDMEPIVNALLLEASLNPNIKNVTLWGCRYNIPSLAPVARQLLQLQLSCCVCSDQLLFIRNHQYILNMVRENDALAKLGMPADFCGPLLTSLLNHAATQPKLYELRMVLHYTRDADSLSKLFRSVSASARGLVIVSDIRKVTIVVTHTHFTTDICKTLSQGFLDASALLGRSQVPIRFLYEASTCTWAPSPSRLQRDFDDLIKARTITNDEDTGVKSSPGRRHSNAI